MRHGDDVQRPAKGSGLDCAGANGPTEASPELDAYLDISTWERGELEQRLMGPLKGVVAVAAQANQHDKDAWFVVDSYCRQQLWGDWDKGRFKRGVTALPPEDPRHPSRTSLAASCRSAMRPPAKPAGEPTLPRRPDPTPCEGSRDPGDIGRIDCDGALP